MFSREVTEESNDLFFVSSSNWECVVEAEDPEEAATKAVEERIDITSGETEVSTIILALNLNEALLDGPSPNNLHILYSPKILANAGLHESSKNLQQLIKELKDNAA